nr:enoyl-CoA hydratase/isomerase family protein [Kibdelosporangium sp. MJ126-NF4]CEL19909.1 Enoyl-CoA hydratase [Kibdelosporangium sp. MJ126-NF4]CTQ97133.1 Enoyl-CoA hydratase (EC 4.2.1.17) [Kibdelosporangium sp. MJ126-NF4]
MTTVEITRPEPHVAVITLNNPPVNTLSWASRADLRTALADLDDEKDVRALVITGAGRAFTAGADLAEDLAMESVRLNDFVGDFGEILDRIEGFRAPVIAAVNGPAVGGGFELALACDIRIASTEAYFVAAGVNVGLMANFWRLVRLVGLGPAKQILLTGERCQAAEAFRWGLVTKVHMPQDLTSGAMAVAQRVASRAPLSVEATKRCASRAPDLDRDAANQLQVEEFTALFHTVDHKEALRAFFAKTTGEYQRR